MGNCRVEDAVCLLVQVLQPFTRLLHSPEVLESPTLNQDAQNIIVQVLQPIFSLLEASIQGNRSGEIFRRHDSIALHDHSQRPQGKLWQAAAALSTPFHGDQVDRRDPGMVELRIT